MPHRRREATASTASKEGERKKKNLKQENATKRLKVAPVQSLGWRYDSVARAPDWNLGVT
jgi:hypothetical protein